MVSLCTQDPQETLGTITLLIIMPYALEIWDRALSVVATSCRVYFGSKALPEEQIKAGPLECVQPALQHPGTCRWVRLEEGGRFFCFSCKPPSKPSPFPKVPRGALRTGSGPACEKPQRAVDLLLPAQTW